MLTTEFANISSNLSSGYGLYGTADPYTTSGPYASNAGARNPLGAVYWQPAQSVSGGGVGGYLSGAGYGAGLIVKYVKYLDSAKPAMKSGPAPVYWADNTFTVVQGTFATALVNSKSVSVAGWLLPNTGTVANVGVGTAVSATILDNAGLGSYVFIALAGFVSSAYVGTQTAGYRLYGSGDFAVTGVAPDGASTYSDFAFCGWALAASSSSIAHIMATCPLI